MADSDIIEQLQDLAQATFAPPLVEDITTTAAALRSAGMSDPQIVQTLAAQMGIPAGGVRGARLEGVFAPEGQSVTVGDATQENDILQQLLQGNDPFLTVEDFLGYGLNEAQANEALLRQFGILPPRESQSSQTNAAAAWLNAQTAQAQQAAQEAYQNGILALQKGQLDLAIEQFQAGEYWNQVAADVGMATSQATAAGDFYGRQSTDRSQRGALELGASGQYGGLAALLGNLATTQAQMGIDLLTNPRNATAAFLLGQGADPSKAAQFGQFNVERLLGINPAQIGDMINAAAGAAAAAQQRASEPTEIALGKYLELLADAAKKVGEGRPSVGPTEGSVYTPPDEPAPEESFQRQPTGAPVTVKPNKVNTTVVGPSVVDEILGVNPPRGQQLDSWGPAPNPQPYQPTTDWGNPAFQQAIAQYDPFSLMLDALLWELW